MLKYLRIAVTALSLTACVLLIAMWVRSYQSIDKCSVAITGSRALHFFSVQGGITAYSAKYVPGYYRRVFNIRTDPVLQSADFWAENADKFIGFYGFGIIRPPYVVIVCFPHWLVSLLAFSLAAIPWFKCRFSLRALLIATTLVVLTLGVIVAAT